MLIPLDDPRAVHTKLAGAKGAGLARLAGHGLPVPRSFVVTTEAWRAYFSQPLLAGHIRDLLNCSSERRSEYYRRLQASVHTTPMPPELLAAATAYLPGIRQSIVCRSSAVIEDGATRSFAGMLSSHLGLPPTLPALAAGIKAVWLSLLAPHTLDYLDAMVEAGGSDAIAAGCAVLVQPLVRSERSGVLFRDRDRVRIEAILGLGLPLVAGKVTPDVYDWTPSEWSQRIEPFKRAALVPTAPGWRQLLPGDGVVFEKAGRRVPAYLVQSEGGVSVVRIGYPGDSEPVLALSECERLAELAGLVGDRLSLPRLDMEWTWCGSRPILLQARPITVPLPGHDSPVARAEGMGLAAGVADGRLWSPDGDAVPPDEPFILFVRQISPEHLRHIAAAAGVVAQTGGLLSHGAIICRELGKPLVVLGHQSEKPMVGQHVRLNGWEGWICCAQGYVAPPL